MSLTKKSSTLSQLNSGLGILEGEMELWKSKSMEGSLIVAINARL